MSLVAVRKVSKNFGAHMVLDGIDLEVDAGEVVAIIGRSGSGKSTLLRCINGLEPVDRGEIRVNCRLVTRRRADLRKLHGEVGIVFQSLNLFPHLSVERNITLGLTVGKKIPLAEAKRLARATLAEVDLLDKIDAYPAHLSGGQQQRVAIARALAMQPALLLFDEITSALDPEMISEVVRVLERLARLGKTMIIVTHEMGFARSAATTLVFMHQGRVWERGIPRQLLNAPRTPELAAFLSAFMRADPMTGA